MDLARTVTIDVVEWRRVQDDRAYLTRRVHELTDEVDELKDALRRAKASLNASNGRRSPRSRSRTPQRTPRHPPAGTSDLPGAPTASVPSHERSAARWIGGDASAIPRREPSTRTVSASGGGRYSYRHAGGETPSRPGDGVGNDSSTETDGDARSFAESFATTRSEARRWATRDAARASTAAGRLMHGQRQRQNQHQNQQQQQQHQRRRRLVTATANGRVETPSHAATPWSSASRLDAAERMALLQAEIESLRVAMEAPYASNDGRGTMGGGIAGDSELLFGDGGEPLPPHPWRGVSGAERVYAASLTNSRSDQSTRSTGSAASTPLRGERSPGRRRHERSSSRESLGSPARPKRTVEEATWDVNVDDIL